MRSFFKSSSDKKIIAIRNYIRINNEKTRIELLDRFHSDIHSAISKYSIPENSKKTFFANTVKAEFLQVTLSLKESDISGFVENDKTFLQQLSQLCSDKINIEGANVADHAHEAVWIKDNIAAFIRIYKNRIRTKTGINEDLIDTVSESVIYRTARVIINTLKKDLKKLIFSFGSGKIIINHRFIEEYFIEQLQLYVYLFKNKERAHFIMDALVKVKSWALKDIRSKTGDSYTNEELIPYVEDIISSTLVDFLKKYEKQSQNEDAFFLDSSFSTYLIGFIIQANMINKLIKELIEKDFGNKNPPPDESIEPFEPDSSDLIKKIYNCVKDKISKHCLQLFNDIELYSRISQECINEIIKQLSKCKNNWIFP